MFNPNSESLTSTGEPPTTSGSRNNMSSASTHTNQQEMSSLSVLEPSDSGYEASPSSIADNQSFFSEQSVHRQSNVQQSTEEFDIVQCHSQILFSESESDELDDYDTCLECSSSQISCNCHLTDSLTNATAMNNCDNSSSVHRPSSQPIQIPMSSCRVNAQLVIGSPVSLRPLTRSQPIDLCPLQRLIPERPPLSWPSLNTPFRHLSLALAPPRSNIANIIRRNNHPVRNRRQLIDSEYSDASSYSSSDDEGLEDVFHMPSGEASSYPTASITMGSSSVPLPDVVLESTDSGRRGRSMSVNLPPDSERHVREIGQNLRRMSDQFQQRHQVRVAMRARSRTTSDCDHLRRNGLS